MTPHQSNMAFEVLLRMRRVKPERRTPSNSKSAEKSAEWKIRRMAEALGSTYEAVIGSSQKHDVSLIRHIIAYQLRVVHGMTLQATGRALGNRNHATISSSVNVCKGLIEIGDRRFLEMIGKL